MPKKKIDEPIWLSKPEPHDYPAAYDYLELVFTPKKSKSLVEKLKKAPMIKKKAKDILRASRLPLLPMDNVHVQANLQKHKEGKKLSPVLLVRSNNGLVIADGYHRVVSIYYLSEDLTIPCKLV